LATPATLAGDSQQFCDCRKIRQRFPNLVRSCNKLKQVIMKSCLSDADEFQRRSFDWYRADQQFRHHHNQPLPPV